MVRESVTVVAANAASVSLITKLKLPARSGTPEMTPDPDSDEFALAEGYITVTPLHFDLTDWRKLGEMQKWSWDVSR